MTHNQVSWLLGKREADINQQNADTRAREVDVKEEDLEASRDIAKENIRANRESQSIGTAIAVAAIVVSIAVAIFW